MTSSPPPTSSRLTDEIEPQTNGRDLIITFISVLFVVLLLNVATKWYLETYPSNRGYWLVKEKWQLLQTMPEPVDWLILGDSSGNQGFDPTVLARETGETAVNLATVADMGTLDDAWLLQTYIERFGPPPNIIIIHTFDMWHRPLQPVFIGKSTMPWAAWDHLQPDIDFTFQQKREIFLARYVPLYADNLSLAKDIQGALLNERAVFVKRFSLQVDGFMQHPSATPRRVSREAQASLEFIKNSVFTLDAVNQQSVETIIDLANQYDIQVYFASAPLYEGLAADEAFQLYFQQIIDTLRQLSEGDDHIHVLQEMVVFPANQMESPDHIIYGAAERYTQAILTAIRDTQDEEIP